MTKSKKDKPKSIPNRHLHARVSYLYQAAAYLQTQHVSFRRRDKPKTSSGGLEVSRSHAADKADDQYVSTSSVDDKHQGVALTQQHESPRQQTSGSLGQQRLLVYHTRAITQKSRLHMSSELKRSMCKRCDLILTAGVTCTTRIENQSRGGKKTWADVLVTTCLSCGAVKRFPIGAKRQPKKKERQQQNAEAKKTS